MRAARIFGHVAADGAGALAGRIGGEMKTQVGHGYAHVGIHHSRLDRGTLIFGVDCKDAIHARKNYQDAALARERSAGKAGPSAAADDRRLMAVRNLDDTDDILGVAREDDAVWPRDFHRSIVFV